MGDREALTRGSAPHGAARLRARWQSAELIHDRYRAQWDSEAPAWVDLTEDQREAWLDLVAPWIDGTLDAWRMAEVLVEAYDAMVHRPPDSELFRAAIDSIAKVLEIPDADDV